MRIEKLIEHLTQLKEFHGNIKVEHLAVVDTSDGSQFRMPSKLDKHLQITVADESNKREMVLYFTGKRQWRLGVSKIGQITEKDEDWLEFPYMDDHGIIRE